MKGSYSTVWYQAVGLAKLKEGMPWVLGALRGCAAAGGKGVLFAHHRLVLDLLHLLY